MEMPAQYRVLVVEDNRDAGQAMKRLLGELGHQAEVAATGGQALEVARRFQPQIVLVDLVLPDIDGCDLVDDLKQALQGAAVRYVAVTGHDGLETRIKVARCGCETLLTKPVKSDALEALLNARAP